MLTPEEKKAQREWQESQLTEEQRLLRKAKRREYQKRRAKLLRERKIINGWNK